MQFGLRVRELRTKRGLTQEELGVMAGVHRTRISRVESGTLNVTLDTLVALADAFGLTLSELFEGVEVPDDILAQEELPLAFSLAEGRSVRSGSVRREES